MSIEEENKVLVRRIFEILNATKGDVDRLRNASWDDIFNKDFIIHYPTQDRNLAQFIEYNAVLLAAFPDSTFTVDDIIAEDDKVAARYTMRGTHEKEFMGIPPTRKFITVKGISIDRFVDGKDIETWDFPDTFGAMQQLGAT